MERKYVVDISTLIDEWNWAANESEGLSPDSLSYGSTKTAHWICKKGHCYKARIDHRSIMNSGCPYCAGKKPILGENDLATTHSHLLDEWDYEQNEGLNPQDYLPGSNKSVFWMCKECGHRWQTKIVKRALKGTNCPVCAKAKRVKTRERATLKNNGSLAQTHPQLAKEWDGEQNKELTPYEVTAGSNKKVFWIGKECGHSWKSSIVNRVNGNGCPICAGKTVLKGFNDLETKFPEISSQWHPTLNNNNIASNYHVNSEKKVWWLCPECGHEYKTSIYSRTRLKTNCPLCANRIVIKDVNDLSTIHPEIAKQWHPTKNGEKIPYDVAYGSNNIVWWRCDKGHEWRASISSRVRGRGCPECAKVSRPVSRQITYLKKNGSLEEKHPNLVKQWHPTKNKDITPAGITSGSSKGIWWICEKGHEWKATVNSRVRGNGCPICSGEHSTSFPEQALYYYLSQVINSVNRYKLDGKELDIFIPELKIGIEYNGRYYHLNRTKQDLNKIRFFNENGIRVIVVWEGDRDLIEGDNIFYKYINKDYFSLKWVIEYITKLLNLPTQDVDIARDYIQIQEQYVLNEKKNSLAVKYPWTIEEWDYERNGRLTPYHISYGSSKRINWKCTKCSYRWEAVAHTRKKSGCPMCARLKKRGD